MTTRAWLLGCVLATVGTIGCSDRVSTVDAAVEMDANAVDVGVDAAIDAAAPIDAHDHDVGTDTGPDVGTDAGPLDCTTLPECAASKGCGATLTEACCCGGTVFNPDTLGDCCCGYGIIPGNHLHC